MARLGHGEQRRCSPVVGGGAPWAAAAATDRGWREGRRKRRRPVGPLAAARRRSSARACRPRPSRMRDGPAACQSGSTRRRCSRLCVRRCGYGELVIGGFSGTTLPRRIRSGAARGAARRGHPLQAERRGRPALRWRRSTGSSTRRRATCRRSSSIDQEGGRVARLKAPLLEVPPMRTVASWGDVALAERIAQWRSGPELAALGFTIDFAPVLDVNTRPENPVIGDRAFGDDAETCARFGAAWIARAAGGRAARVRQALPRARRHDEGLARRPARGGPAARAAREGRARAVPGRRRGRGWPMMMTAHVVYTALDRERPRTLSAVAATELRNAHRLRRRARER